MSSGFSGYDVFFAIKTLALWTAGQDPHMHDVSFITLPVDPLS